MSEAAIAWPATSATTIEIEVMLAASPISCEAYDLAPMSQ
jgi:hypothetical protein